MFAFLCLSALYLLRMFSRFIHIVAIIRISFLFKAEWYFIICIYHILLIHSSTDAHLGCCYLLAAVNIGVQISVWVLAFSSFGYVSRSGIAGLYVILCLTFWETSILSPTITIPFYFLTSKTPMFQFLHVVINTYFLFKKMVVILVGVNWYLSLCGSDLHFPNRNLEKLFMCLLAICISSLEKCLFNFIF